MQFKKHKIKIVSVCAHVNADCAHACGGQSVAFLGCCPPIRLDWLASRPEESACPHLPKAQITCLSHRTQLFNVDVRDQIQVLMLS